MLTTPLRPKTSSHKATLAALLFMGAFAVMGSTIVLSSLAATTPASADVNKDGKVNILDLSAVISAWGLTGTLPADVNGDKVVGILDLSGVISNWSSATSPTPTVSVTPPPPTPTPSGASVIPSSAKVVFRGDYETCNFSQWDHVQNNGASYAATILTGTAAATGKCSARFEMHPGDKPFAGGDRDEVSRYAEAIVHEGDERWYDFTLKFDPTFHNPTSDWFIVMQWHDASGTGSPPMNLNVNRDGTLWLLNNNTHQTPKQIGAIKRGVWVHYVIHAKFSSNASNGWAEVYQDGQLVLPKHSRANMSNSYNYFKEGMYSPMQSAGHNQIISFDGPVIYAP